MFSQMSDPNAQPYTPTHHVVQGSDLKVLPSGILVPFLRVQDLGQTGQHSPGFTTGLAYLAIVFKTIPIYIIWI